MAASPRLRVVSDVSPSAWLAANLGPFGSGVRSLLPQNFEAYARILHPAWIDRMPVRWSEVAAWSGKTFHSRVQFDAVSRPSSAAESRPAPPWNRPPDTGNMPSAILRHLCDMLDGRTSSPDQCWFCLWDGYGWIGDSSAADARTRASTANSKGSAAELGTSNMQQAVPPVFTEQIIEGPRVNLPNRRYFLLRGPLDAATELGWMLDNCQFVPQSPNLFWPDDRSWCVATEIDLDSSYLGGSETLVERLLADQDLEALRVMPGDPIDSGSDEINRLAQGVQ
jgi:hypothetical protein